MRKGYGMSVHRKFKTNPEPRSLKVFSTHF